MLRKMLNAHPEIAMPPEGEYILRVPQLHGKRRLPPEGVDDFVDLIDTMPNGFFRDRVDRAGFRRMLLARAPVELPVLLASIYQQWADQQEKGHARWGDKKPQHWPLVDALRQMYPQSLYIHTVRDPRDVVASMKVNFPEKIPLRRLVPPHVLYAWHWKEAYWDGVKQGRILGQERFLGLRYEKLVEDPRGQLEQICTFLQMEFDERMLLFYLSKGSKIRPVWQELDELHKETKDPAHQDNIGRYQKRLSAEEVREVEYICRREMAAMGCEPTAGKIPGWRKAHIDALLPLCAGAWKGLRAYRRMMGSL